MNSTMPKESLSSEITLRQAKRIDLECLQTIYKETIDHTCINDYDPDQRDAWKQGTENLERWTTAIYTQYFIIAEVNGEPAGFGSLMDSHYIDFMYTGKNYLRQGIARTIYNRLEEKATEMGTKVLTADVSKTARPFFERQGFVLLAENRNFIDGLLIINFRMHKELPICFVQNEH
ncbi:GNAT family N-acetyltransferase [Dyadobacter flavalbus]|uniref:GNAT family N-acetyltransferase n=1 Tax=Dyadobacter flavalbus TaxID=2579942 RepID=A0A5M8QY41_9BACT|nr:GNAT family N-acetyltransferase [Dyadobacter flavalbus]KAA6438912.1 GNAT family N-acetyltransferase [Dyadobacter flavalbus]